MVIGLAIAFLGYRLTQRQVQNECHARFVQTQSTIKATLYLLFNEYANILSGLKGLIENRDEITPEEFKRYLTSINIRQFKAHLLDVGFAKKVNREEWNEHLVQAKRLGFTRYQPQIQPADSEAFPIYYFYDFKTPEVHGGGFNIYANPERRTAMESAFELRRPSATATVRLVTFDGKQEPEGFVMYMPVYRKGIQPDDLRERRKELIGFVFGSIITESLAEGILKASQATDIDWKVFDGTNVFRDRLIFDSGKLPLNRLDLSLKNPSRFKSVEMLDELCRNWTLCFASLAGTDPNVRSRLPWVVLGAGLVTTLALWTLVWIQIRARLKAEADAQELARAGDALASEKERLSITLRSIGDGVATVDAKGAIVLFNQAAEKLTGWTAEEAYQHRFGDVCRFLDQKTRKPIELSAPFSPVRAAQDENFTEAHLVSRDGEERLVRNSCAPILDHSGAVRGAVFVFRDITQQEKLLEEQIKVGKLESIGTLAGGIAHDFNNILTTILGNIAMTRQAGEDKGASLSYMTQAEKACMQARNLTQQLLTFAKGGAPVRQSISLPDIIDDAARFATTGSNSRCSFAIAAELWPVDADKGQISQVIQNIVLNACQAMREGGEIEVRASNVVVEGQSYPALQPGRYVKIDVQDHGEGIPPENLSRVFDPYFSTKQRGTGLGLATCYSIIKRHDGHIQIFSVKGKGSVVSFWLPASDKKPVRIGQEPLVVHSKLPRKLLLMDDDPHILKILTAMLQCMNVKAVPTRDGAEAVQEYKKAMDMNDPFDGVILDLTVPGGMGGRETIKQLRLLNPSVKAVVSSGYSNDPVLASYQEYGFISILAKPYQMATLAKTLNEALSAS